MPKQYKGRTGTKPRGVANRNHGLQWVLSNADHGVIYFADDDNTYDIRIFKEVEYNHHKLVMGLDGSSAFGHVGLVRSGCIGWVECVSGRAVFVWSSAIVQVGLVLREIFYCFK